MKHSVFANVISRDRLLTHLFIETSVGRKPMRQFGEYMSSRPKRDKRPNSTKKKYTWNNLLSKTAQVEKPESPFKIPYESYV